MGTGSFPWVKSGRGVKLTPHSLLVPWSWKGRAIPLPHLWAVWPVQSLSACTRVHFTLTYLLYCENGTNHTRNLCGRSAALLMLTQLVWLPFVQVSQFEINECHALCLTRIAHAIFFMCHRIYQFVSWKVASSLDGDFRRQLPDCIRFLTNENWCRFTLRSVSVLVDVNLWRINAFF